jgi:hypothetical protein
MGYAGLPPVARLSSHEVMPASDVREACVQGFAR